MSTEHLPIGWIFFLCCMQLCDGRADSLTLGDECDPKVKVRFTGDHSNEFVYCSLEGRYEKYVCHKTEVFSEYLQECVSSLISLTPARLPTSNNTRRQFISSKQAEKHRQTDLGSCQGGVAYIDPSTGQLQTCRTFDPAPVCPSGYFCSTISFATANGICCTGTAAQVATTCPNGGAPVTIAGLPLQCTAAQGCPTGYLCSSSTVGQGICCPASSTFGSAVCPSALAPLSVANLPVLCNLAAQNCPSGYSCTTVFAGGSAQSVCCPQQQTSVQGNVCDNGSTPALVNGFPVFCSPNSGTNCPTGYSCQQSVSTSQYTCCQTNSASTVCPLGQNVALSSGLPQTCSPGTTSTCPTAYSCRQAPTVFIWFCCGPDDGCPVGQVAYYDTSTKQPVTCNPSPSISCPPGFNCVYSQSRQKNVCCGQTSGIQSAGCPANSVAYISSTTTLPQGCFLGQQTCPTGFQCVLSSTMANQGVCCSTAPPLKCPSGGAVLMVGNTVTLCSASSPCPLGFVCSATSNPNAQINVCCYVSTTPVSCPLGFANVQGVCKRVQCALLDN